jgi:DNA-binding protein Fis
MTDQPSDNTLSTIVRMHIVFVVGLCDGNRRKAASMLGISRSTLYRHLELYGIEVAK